MYFTTLHNLAGNYGIYYDDIDVLNVFQLPKHKKPTQAPLAPPPKYTIYNKVHILTTFREFYQYEDL